MIVPKETFNRVQERMKQHKHKGGKENAKQNYLLSGKVRCMDCGR